MDGIHTINSKRVKMTRAEPARVLIPGVTHLSNDSPLTLQQKAVFNEK